MAIINKKGITEQINGLVQKKINRLLRQQAWGRVMLSKLRKGFGRQIGEQPELFEVLLEDTPEQLYSKGDEPSYAEQAIYTALTLFALHQQGKDHSMSKKAGNSFGAAIGKLVQQNKDRETAIKRRFDAIITANDLTGFTHHARGLFQLLRDKDINLDYPRFAEDLYWYQFDGPRNKILLHWSEDYYRASRFNSTKNNEKEKGEIKEDE